MSDLSWEEFDLIKELKMEKLIDNKVGITMCVMLATFYGLQAYIPDNIYVRIEKRFMILVGPLLASLLTWKLVK
jgi:hypothetical protein